MTHQYIVVTKQFAEQHDGQKDGCNVFHAWQTSDGRYVTGVGAIDEFPELFGSNDAVIVTLGPQDFPAPVSTISALNDAEDA